MNVADREHVKKLLAEAAGLQPDLRRAFIERSAPGHPQAAAEALALLPSLEEDEFMASPTGAGWAGPNTESTASWEKPGARIGRYKLLQHVGEGGFGIVFMAEQVEPVVRRVALKIIKAGMDTRQVIARFEAERQALAMMDHPNIARVLDAGATEAGRPYFVMELVRGEAVTHYCDRRQLSVEERLSLFQDICSAVQHAHQKGIIHRDLKPSNVLVTVADGKPIPKVIDFGIAKATRARLTDKTLFTEHRQLIGTPEYMSPEQAEVSGIDIDTRSDIYSLGVLLYELLAGGPPFDSRRLRSAPFAEIQRIIRDEEPPRPSLRLRTLAASSNIEMLPSSPAANKPSTDSAMEIARRRRSEPISLARSLRGDLDWIVMKCLEKDRTRRYETASALAGDVTAYLAHAPVSASPPRAFYKLRKMIRRHRGAMATAATMAVTLILATSVAITSAVRASRALAAEASARRLADQRAQETQQVAQFQAALLSDIDVEAMGRGIKELFREQVRTILGRQFVGEWPKRRKLTEQEAESDLRAYDRITGFVQPVDIARNVLNKYVLARGGGTIEKKFPDQPRVRADLLQSQGSVAHSLGLLEPAEAALRRALELRSDDATDNELARADLLTELAAVLAAQSKNDEAAKLYREALRIYQQRLGRQDDRTIRSLKGLGGILFAEGDMAEAEKMLRETVVDARQLPAEHRLTLARTLGDLGAILQFNGDRGEAEKYLREALDMLRQWHEGPHVDIADGLNNLAGILYEKDDFDGCEAALRESIEMRRALAGDECVAVATSINNLASVYYERNEIATARTLFEEALNIYRRTLGDEHPDVAGTLNNIGMMLKIDGDLEGAEPILREVLDLRRRTLGEDHPDVGLSASNLGYLLLKQRQPEAAETLFREASAIHAKKLKPGNGYRISTEVGLATSLMRQDHLEEAEQVLLALDRSVEFEKVSKGTQGSIASGFIELYELRDRAAPGLGFAEKATQWRKKVRPDSPDRPAITP